MRVLSIALLSCCVALGCSDSDTSSGTDTAGADTSSGADTAGADTSSSTDTAGADTTGTAMISLSGTLVDALSDAPIEGVMVCFDQPTGIPCLTTDANGFGTTMLPVNTLLQVRITKAGYMPVLTFGNTETTDIAGIQLGLLSEAAADASIQIVGETRDAAKGHVLFSAATNVTLQDHVADVAATTTATTGTQFYANASGVPDTTLTATTTSGAGARVNIDPGTYEVTFAHGSKTCVDGFAWPATTQPAAGVAVQLPIEAGVMTFLSTYCN